MYSLIEGKNSADFEALVVLQNCFISVNFVCEVNMLATRFSS